MKWVNERRIPKELIKLLQDPDLPEELRASILQAIDEVRERGAVTYTTKARVESFLHSFINKLEQQELKVLEDMWNREIK